jgi:SAM-dependent methyltransferase
VIGIDLGPAVEAAAANTADLDNVHVVQGDLTRPPFRAGTFDLIYSIGVLHHLGDPAAGFRGLAPLLRPEARFVAWLYAREGNGWVVGLVDPARRLTSRLPLGIVRPLAGLLTVPLWLALKLLYGPAASRPRLRRLLPYQSYLCDLAGFPFREVHSIAFDQLLAPVAHYMPRAEVERCFAEGGIALRGIRWHHANSWAAWGVPAR